MATITLKYNEKNTIAKKTIDYILSLGVFKLSTPEKKLTGVEQALEEIKRGEIVECDSVDDMFKKLEMSCK